MPEVHPLIIPINRLIKIISLFSIDIILVIPEVISTNNGYKNVAITEPLDFSMPKTNTDIIKITTDTTKIKIEGGILNRDSTNIDKPFVPPATILAG